ncbi:MAG TPA: HNH endonuclease [Nitrososphaeraceae archaeon]|nr:HNH endonuclease [Nitrososphaeraceae archaeon]
MFEEIYGYNRRRKFLPGHNASLRLGTENPNYGKRGPAASMYKSGRTLSGDKKYWILSGKQGYPRADRLGRIYEHSYNYQEYYKVCLLKWTQIHHKNKNGLDNRISNLVAVMKKEHTKIHHPKKDRENTFCMICGGKTTTDKRGYDRWHKYQDGYRCDICYKRAMREQGKID